MKELYDIYDSVIADSYKLIFSKLTEIHKNHPYSKDYTIVVDYNPLDDAVCYAYHIAVDACGLMGWQVKVNATAKELQDLWQAKKFLKKIKRTNLPKNLTINQIITEANKLLKDNGLTVNCGAIYSAYWEDKK